ASSLLAPSEGVAEAAAYGQGGLHDVLAARDFARSGTIFFCYAEPGRGGAGTAVARAKLVRDGRKARLDNVERIFSMERKSRTGIQFGCRVLEAADGTLFVTVGDQGEMDRAQDPKDP